MTMGIAERLGRSRFICQQDQLLCFQQAVAGWIESHRYCNHLVRTRYSGIRGLTA